MKKIVAMLLVIITLTFALVACGGKEIVGIVPKYSGEPVAEYDENREFTADDFTVWVMYKVEDGQEVTKDFEFEVIGSCAEYYVVEITYKEWKEPVYVWIGEDEAEESAE